MLATSVDLTEVCCLSVGVIIVNNMIDNTSSIYSDFSSTNTYETK